MADVSVVIPARDEPAVWSELPGADDLLVVVDDPYDQTPGLVYVQDYGPGPANAIRWGIDNSRGSVVVIMCADGSDDPDAIPALVAAIRDGATIACGDRYMFGGERVGGPRIKGAMSRLANRALGLDATSLYKAYDGAWLRRQVIESRHGFTIGLEMVAKARREGLTMVRVPVIWHDRTAGKSHWHWSWLPSYARWWAAARMASRAQSSAPPKSRDRRQGKAPAWPTGGAS